MASSVQGLFGGMRRGTARGSRRVKERAAQRTRFESLEPRAMLAITGLPATAGDQFGAAIVLATNGVGPNALSITLDDVSNPGKVTATINGTPYFNFGNSISFTGTFDTAGTVDNQVALDTPYGFALTSGTPNAWNTTANFSAVGLPGVTLKLLNADSLALSTPSATLPSTVTGTFTSPTLGPPPGASIALKSNGPLSVLSGGVSAYDFSFTGTKNAVAPQLTLQGKVVTTNAITITDSSNVSIDQPLTAGGAITITTVGAPPPGGTITINKTLTAGGAITVTAAQALTTNASITSTAGSVALTSGNGNVLTVNDDVTATVGPLTLTGDGGILTNAKADLLAVTGALDLASTEGPVTALGSLTAAAAAVNVTSTKLAVSTADVQALTGFKVAAGTTATLSGATSITGTGNVRVTATSGNVSVLPSSPISVADGTIDLQAVAGTVSVEANVVANQTITVQAGQGVVLSNAVDTKAELRATGVGGNVTITNAANQVLVDAPVTSQAGAVAITSAKNDVLVRDNVSALLDVKVAANTKATLSGVAPGTISLTSQTGVIDVSSTTDGVTLGPNLVVVAGPGAAAGVSLTALTEVDLQVPISAQGDITITSPDKFVVQQALTSALGKVTITSAAGPVTAAVAPIVAGDQIAITGASVSVSTTLSSTVAGIALTATGTSVNLGAAASLVAPDVTKGVVAITAAGAFSMGGPLAAGNNLAVTAGANFAPTHSFTSTAGSITIAVTAGNLDVTGSTITALAPAGNVTVSASGNLTMNVSKIAVGVAAGSLSATAGGGLTIVPSAAISVGGSLSLSSVDPAVGFAPPAGADLFAKTGSIALKFGGTVDVSNISVQAPLGSVALTSTAGNVVVGTKAFVVEAASLGAITLDATTGAVTVGQALLAGNDIKIAAFNTFALGFGLTSNAGDIGITSTGGDVKVGGATLTAPAGTITLTAATGRVDLGTNAYTAGTGFTATALNTLTVQAPITTTAGGIDLRSTGGDVALTGTANLTALGGTITLFADGEINSGTTGGAVTTFVQANVLLATAQGAGLGPAPVFTFTNPLNNVSELEVALQTAALVPIGAGVTYVDADNFTVNGLVNAVGNVALTALAGGLTVNATIGVAGNPLTTLTGITLAAVGPLTVNGGLATNGTGAIRVTSSANAVQITGPVATANGAVAITSGGGTGLTVGDAIGALGPAGVATLLSNGTIIVTGSVTSTGAVTATSAAGGVTIAGNVAAGATSDFTATGVGGIGIAGTIFAGRSVSITTLSNVTLGGSAITANTGSVSVTSTGGTGNITVAAATIAGDSIVINTSLPGTGSVTFNGGSLTASQPFVPGGTSGLIQIIGNTVAVPGAPTIVGGRLELRSVGVTPIALTGNNSVGSLGVSAGGSLTFTNYSKLLEITDFNPLVANPAEVSTGGNLTITQNMLSGEGGRFRVVDGLSVGGSLSLAANQSALGVEFVTTSAADNPGVPPVFAGTLRDMIGYINANTATNGTTNATMSAVFDEPGSFVALLGTVTPLEALPDVAKRIVFDGSLPAFAPPLSIGGDLGIVGASVPTTVNGLTFVPGSGGSTIQDVAIHNFKGAGLEIRSGDNTVQNVRSGFDRAGNAAGNGVGIRLSGPGAARNVIGTQAIGNEIGNNTGPGLVIQAGASYTSVYSNSIGVQAGGLGAANGGDGIQITGGRGNVIGPASTTQGMNVISGNGGRGVSMLNVLGSAIEFGTRLFNNTITNNTAAGVLVQGGGFNQIGTANAGNTIQSNRAGGVNILSSGGNVVAGNTVSLNTTNGVLVDAGWATRIEGNVVAGNSSAGVRLRNVAVTAGRATNRVFSNTIQGNGGNQSDGGVVIQASSGQVVGVDGAGRAAGNTVSLNAGSGIVILNGGGTQLPQSNTIANNLVFQNRFDGIRVDGSLGNTVRANTATANAGAGIAVVNAFAANPRDPRFSTGNSVVSNTSSLNAVGIRVQGSSTNTAVGGTLASLGNRVFSNVSHGISVESLGAAVPNGTRVQNNQVGVDAANGSAGNGGDGIALSGAVGSLVNYANSVLNNTGHGLSIVGGGGNVIGSPVRGRANTFASNQRDGINVTVTGRRNGSTPVTPELAISGNLVDDNGGHGIAVAGARVSDFPVRIGRAPSIAVPTGDENTIVNNALDGINVDTVQNVTMIGNLFTANGGQPIRLANGANGGIQPPTILRAVPRSVGGRPMWDVTGTVSGTAGQRFYIDIYDANTVYLGRVLATVGRTGTGTFRVVVAGKANAVSPLKATATLANPSLFGGTSEF